MDSLVYEEDYLDIKMTLLRDAFSSTMSNPIFNEIFDNVTDHYITHSQYLEIASIKDVMNLRVKAIEFYNDTAAYAGAESKPDNFVVDLRPISAVFATPSQRGGFIGVIDLPQFQTVKT
jgi:hypothetical protein